jgi:streptomycin 6-kinase
MSDALAPWLERWGLALEGRPPLPGGREAYPGAGEVAFVRQGGRSMVLKLLPRSGDEQRSGEVLAHWDGRGAVRLIEQAPGAVLIERALPGDDLSAMVQAGRDEEATLILCQVMAQLNRPPPAAARFRTIVDWGQGFARNRPAAVRAGMDGALIDRAERLFRQLCETQSEPIVLHGDLQHYNVVRDAARGWLVIDPKGILGEPAYETGAMLRNPVANPELYADSAIIERRARTICAQLGYPYERVIGWCCSQWVLSVLWALEDGLAFSPSWLDGPLAAQALL